MAKINVDEYFLPVAYIHQQSSYHRKQGENRQEASSSGKYLYGCL